MIKKILGALTCLAGVLLIPFNAFALKQGMPPGLACVSIGLVCLGIVILAQAKG